MILWGGGSILLALDGIVVSQRDGETGVQLELVSGQRLDGMEWFRWVMGG